MTMDRTEALSLPTLDRRIVPEGQDYTAGYFEPADGPGVARLFYAGDKNGHRLLNWRQH